MDGTETKQAVVIIPKSVITGQLRSKWDRKNGIAVFPGSSDFSNSVKDERAEFNIWEVQLDPKRYEGLARRVISESHDIFLEIQEIADMDSATKQRSLMKCSRLYRSILRASFVHSRKKDHCLNFYMGDRVKMEELYSVVELIWQLCEIIFIDSSQAYPIQGLLEWIVWHFPQVDELHKKMILEAHVIREHRNYWPTIYGYVVSGRMNSAVELLNVSVKDSNDKSDPYRKISELLRKMPRPSSSPEYVLKWRHWQQECRNSLTGDIQQHRHLHRLCRIYGYVVSGRMNSAVELLNVSVKDSNDKSDPYRKISELLRKMPRPSSSPEYVLKWRHWQQECRNSLTGDIQQHRHLHRLCRILCGDEKVLQELSNEGVIHTWYHLLVVHILFRNPTTKVYDLHYSIDLSLELFYGDKSRLGKLDEVISAIFLLDTVRVIKEASAGFGDWWFAVHLTDLLYHCGQLKLYKLDYGTDLREYLLLEYGSSLMSASSWQIGSDYLGHCQTYGRYYLEQYISRIPLDSEKKTRKVLHVCEKYGLSTDLADICREECMTAIRREKLGSAISWALYVKDVTLINYIVDCYMSAYIKDGNADRLAIVDDIGAAITLTGQLAFLGKFREFHTFCNTGNLVDAASILVLLMVDGLASKKYWWMLLLDAIPLFETEEILFDSDQTYELLRCLTEIELSLRGPGDSWSNRLTLKQQVHKNSEVLHDALNTIRIALARNLARAHINEEQ
ncbi:Nuclear pore complex protein Nup85 [Trichoplax sp. H2]|nr:Nuclear pore complex protein Nup85 [Trichoplax sp. H2]|eukprot:RDD43923.1 Nuclear pore complex protein Nup85 [Trichoplax sp. H2]